MPTRGGKRRFPKAPRNIFLGRHGPSRRGALDHYRQTASRGGQTMRRNVLVLGLLLLSGCGTIQHQRLYGMKGSTDKSFSTQPYGASARIPVDNMMIEADLHSGQSSNVVTFGPLPL